MSVDPKQLHKDPMISQRQIEVDHEETKMKLKLGKLGVYFGFGDSMKLNIAGGTIGVLVLVGTLYTVAILICNICKVSISDPIPSILQFWGALSPIITLALGYIFGKNKVE